MQVMIIVEAAHIDVLNLCAVIVDLHLLMTGGLLLHLISSPDKSLALPIGTSCDWLTSRHSADTFRA